MQTIPLYDPKCIKEKGWPCDDYEDNSKFSILAIVKGETAWQIDSEALYNTAKSLGDIEMYAMHPEDAASCMGQVEYEQP